MKAQELTSEKRLLTAALLAFALIATLAGVDLLTDLGEGTALAHVLTEGGIVIIGLVGVAFVARMLVATMRLARASANEAQKLASELQASEAEARRWRGEARDLMAGLGQAIDEQFERWQLSPAEKEVALLLLKGLSHKEIASTRSVSEATARQQGRAVYRKGQLAGRHDLAAFFLEDLMLPRDATTERP